MNLRIYVRFALAFALLAAFGITATGADFAPAGELPVLGITLNGLD
jgi:hypothetical protein